MSGTDAIVVGEAWVSEHYLTTDARSQSFTAAVNIPLNNAIQAVDVDTLDASQARLARERFERRWNRWNRIRTALGTLASAGLLVLLLRQ